MDHHALLAWGSSHGIALRNAVVSRISGSRGLGVVATHVIEAGDLVLQVPHALLLTGDGVDLKDIGQTNALALALLQELSKEGASTWAVYLRTLPESFGTPLSFNTSERAALRGTDVLKWASARERNVGLTHNYLLNAALDAEEKVAVNARTGLVDSLGEASESFAWALSIAWSRGFAVNMRAVRGLAGNARRPGLVPIGDFFNHGEENATNVVTTSDPQRAVFEFVATRRILPGEEALLSYSLHGEPSNSKLLLDYGFCTPYSLHDEASVPLQPLAAAPAEEARAQTALLEQMKLAEYARAARLTLAHADSLNPPHELIAIGRVLALRGEALANATVSTVLGAVEQRFEREAFWLLAARIKQRLAVYDAVDKGDEAAAEKPGDVAQGNGLATVGVVTARHEEDEHRLASGAWRESRAAACALHVRTGERRILLHWYRRLRWLSKDEADSSTDDDAPWNGGSRRTETTTAPAQEDAEEKPLQRFKADAVAWDSKQDAAFPAPDSPAILEVRSLPTVGASRESTSRGDAAAQRQRRGVAVARNSRLRLGDIAGCYTGTVVGPEAREAKQHTGFEAYSFPVNGTHLVDPTDASGHVPSDTLHQMALVNEPTDDTMPNLTPMEYGASFGRCHDRDGRPGVPYVAVREILPGEALTVCYGPHYVRHYTTVCSDRSLLGRWTALFERVLQAILTARV